MVRSVGSDVIKSIVFGGLDGIITTFSVVAAVAGSGLGIKLLILMGVANLVGDGISMGVGDFLSSKAEMDHILQERAREQWCVLCFSFLVLILSAKPLSCTVLWMPGGCRADMWHPSFSLCAPLPNGNVLFDVCHVSRVMQGVGKLSRR